MAGGSNSIWMAHRWVILEEGAGGLIGDSNELWVKGFTRNIGISSNVDAKLWALSNGLPLCISLKFWLWRLKLMLKLFLIGFLVSTIVIYIIPFLVWTIGFS